MSYSIIRNVKHKMNGIVGAGKHNERENKNYSNPNIDLEKKEENYHFKKPTSKSYKTEFEKIRKENNLAGQIKTKGKMQSNVVNEFMITSNPEFFKSKTSEEIYKFFNDSYDFVKEKCGEEFVLSAVVHMDEKTPHMHAVFIPVVLMKNEKTGEIEKRIHCSQFWKGYNSYGILQDEYHKFITDRGHDLKRGEKNTKREHLEVGEFKRQTLVKEIKKLNSLGREKQKELINISDEIHNYESVVLQREEIVKIKPEPGFGNMIKNITVKDIEKLKKSAIEYHIVLNELTNVSNKYIDLKSNLPSKSEVKQHEKELDRLHFLEKENKKLASILKQAGLDLDEIKKEKGIEVER